MTSLTPPLWLSLALRELRASRAFTSGFILNLALGFVGLATLDLFKTGIESQIEGRSQSTLGADVVISGSRVITDAEAQTVQSQLPPGSRLRWEEGLLSMVSTADGQTSRLLDLRAIDGAYPFYGTLTLRQRGEITESSSKSIVESPEVWASPEVLVQLGVSVGAQLKIGSQIVTLTDVIDFDPNAGTQGFAIAPKMLMGRRFLTATGLLGPGTRRSQSLLIALPPKTDAPDVARRLKAALASPDLQIKTHVSAARDMNRALTYLSDYLGLAALVALFLTGVGGSYLFAGHLARRLTNIAILLSLGLSPRKVILVYTSQLLLLASAAVLLALLLTPLGTKLLLLALGPLAPMQSIPWPSLGHVLTIALVATLAALLTAAPALLRLRSIRPASLFQEASMGVSSTPEGSSLTLRSMVSALPALVFFVSLAIGQSHSVKIGLLFFGILGAAALTLGLLGALLLGLLARLAQKTPLAVELACLRLSRYRFDSLVTMTAMGLSTLLLTLIPLLEQVIQSGVEAPASTALPSLFFFDIQEDQAKGLTDLVTQKGARLGPLAPLIRARLLKINDTPVTKIRQGDDDLATREEEEAERTLNRGFNLSYREELARSEKILSGRPFSGPFVTGSGQRPEVSLEVRFADRLGAHLGDRLLFDIQGVEIEGEVINLRSVQWTSFEPNFFIQFQPGVLNDAPKTLIAAGYGIDGGAKVDLQRAIVSTYPNISLVDVAALMQRFWEITQQISQALKVMALLTLLAGFGVLLAMARVEADRRQPELVLLKTLGVRFATLKVATLLEFALLGSLAASSGAGIAWCGAAIMGRTLFEQTTLPPVMLPLLLAVGIATMGLVVGYLTTNRSLHRGAREILGRARFDR